MSTPMSTKWFAALGVAAVFMATHGAAQGVSTTFLTHAAQGGEAEIQLGELAQRNAADPRVKAFGERMRTDHGNANAELRAIIAKKGLTIPGGPGPHTALKKRLDGLQGAEFDGAYMRAMVEDHTKAVTEFETAGAKSADSDIKAFAAKTLPTLREHLRMAQELHKSVSSSMRSSSPIRPDAPGARGTSGGGSGPANAPNRGADTGPSKTTR